MTITFENDNDVIVYALGKVISHARKTQQIFVAQCIWWLASVIGLEQGLIDYIDNLPQQEDSVPASGKESSISRNSREDKRTPQSEHLQDSLAGIHPERIHQIEVPRGQSVHLQDSSAGIHPDRVHQVEIPRGVSSQPRDLTEDQRLDIILEEADAVIQDSLKARLTYQKGRVNPTPQSRTQLKKARKIKRLQEAKGKEEADRRERLQELRARIIRNLSKE
jgi:hypothetical protein